MWSMGLVGAASTPSSGLTSLSFVTSSTSSSQLSSISIPASAQAGDLAVLISSASNAAKAAVPAAPTNTSWSGIHNNTFSGGSPELMAHRVYVVCKLLVAGDLGGSVNTVNGTTNTYHTVAVFRPNAAASSASVIAPNFASSASLSAVADTGGISDSGVGVAIVTQGAYLDTFSATTSGFPSLTFTSLAFSPTTTKRYNRYSLLSGTFPSWITATSDTSTSYKWASVAVIKVS